MPESRKPIIRTSVTPSIAIATRSSSSRKRPSVSGVAPVPGEISPTSPRVAQSIVTGTPRAA